MTANKEPVFTAVPNVSWGSTDGNGGSAGPLKTANTALDGTGTVLTVFTAGANGSYVKKLRIKHAGTNVATVLRVFINNGSVNSTAANNVLYKEISLASSTASASTALTEIDIPLNEALPAGYKINVTVGTSVSAGLLVSAFGGDY